jgi:hypothetical protein
MEEIVQMRSMSFESSPKLLVEEPQIYSKSEEVPISKDSKQST